MRRITNASRLGGVSARIMYAVLIRIDPSGECPVIVREGEQLPRGPGVHWRFVAQAASDLEACRIVVALQPDLPEGGSQ